MSHTTSTSTSTAARPVASPVLMTGIKPTGSLHLGNLLGAIRPFQRAAATADATLFGVMNLHALTVPHAPLDVRAKTREVLVTLLACGVTNDSERPVDLFVQSQVRALPELSYLLECVAHVGEVERMIQYRTARSSDSDGAAGTRFSLMSYPVLMAADVLGLDATHVPVGQDQRQHLELTRVLAQRTNHTYGPVFTVPEPLTPPHAARVMDLADPTSKMGKSSRSDRGTVFLLDDEAAVRRKVSRAVTDPDGEVRYDPAAKPGVSNLLSILAALTGSSPQGLAGQFTSYAPLKDAVADAIVTVTGPIRDGYRDLHGDETLLNAATRAGSERARQRADATVARMKEALGVA